MVAVRHDLRTRARAVFDAAVGAMDPTRLVTAMPRRGERVVAVGKAAVAMAGAVGGADLIVDPSRAGHPVPDERSLAAGSDLIELVRGAGDVLALISGGASALVVAPAPGVTFAEKLACTRAVAAAGASISDLNCVRKHLSAIKGGGLATLVRGRARVYVLSDVVGDDPSVIGSGLFAADPTTVDDARAICARFEVDPPPFRETPKQIDNVELHVVGGPDLLVDAAATALPSADTHKRFTATVDELAALLAAAPRSLIVGGEPTIRLSPNAGKGGRAQHTALLVARAIAGRDDIVVLCGASDGVDGNTPHAGAMVDGTSWARATHPDRALATHDSSNALAKEDLLTTGPTGTNVCDLYIVLRAGCPDSET